MLNIPVGEPSQARARAVMGQTTAITPDTIQEIGRAAMAARNAPDSHYIHTVEGLLGSISWPDGHFTTSVDCYTGETLIAEKNSGMTIGQAAAASSSLPGVNGST